MPFTRREFSTLTLSAAAIAAIGPAANLFARRAGSVRMFFEWKEIAPGAKVAFGQGGNALIVSHGGRSLLIDCKNPGLGATLLREAESFGSPIRLVINTHHHRDHTGGNSAFTKSAVLLAQANAKERILAQVEGMLGSVPGILRQLEGGEQPAPAEVIDEVKAFIDSIGEIKPEDFVPTRLVDQRMEADKFEGLEIHYHHIGNGHTDNDLIIFLPSLNVVHMGDLLFHNNWPFIDLSANATTIGWQESLRRTIEICNEKTIVIPGHGEITDVNGLAAQIEFFNKIREVVRHAKDVEGMSKEEAMNLEPGAFAHYGLKQIKPRTLGAIYDELVLR